MKSFSALLVLAAALFLAPFAKADSINMTSHTGDNYNYAITINSSPTFFLLDGFSLTDLTGVTNAYLTGELAEDFKVTFDADSVTVWTLFEVKRSRHVPFSVGTLTIVSNASVGSVDYSILDSNGLFCGTVLGPDGSNGSTSIPAVPEPSTLLMMGTGLIGAAGAVRRKFLS